MVVESAKEGTFLAPIGAMVIAGLMFVCTAYSLSGAGLIKRIPLLKTALMVISIICLVRALIVIPYLFSTKLDMWEVVASAVWFFVGVCFLLGALKQFAVNRTSIE